MEIELTVNSSEIKLINIGDVVKFTDSREKYSGKIIRKGQFVNKNTQNISVFTSITDEKSSLYNGMYLNATITTQGTENTFKLPRRAIFDKDKIFIVDSDKTLRIKRINIIAYEGNQVIIDNLANNTLIVNEPLVNVTEGTIVKAMLK